MSYMSGIRGNKLFKLFVVLFLTISIVIVAVGGAGYLYIVNKYKNNVAEFHTENIYRINQLINVHFSDGEKLAEEILHTANIGLLTEKKDISNPEDLLVAKKLIDSIQYGVDTNPIISDAYIYLNSSQMVISNTGLYDVSFFYNNYVSHKEEKYDTWKENLSAEKNDNYIVAEQKFSKYDHSLIEYYKPFNIYANDIYGCVVLNYDIDAIRDIIDQGDLMDSINFQMRYIPTNQSIISMGDSSINEYLSNKKLERGQNVLLKSPFAKMVVTRETSSNSKWEYISAVPFSTYYSEIDATKFIIMMVIGMQILLGIFLAFLFSLRSYRPINSTVIKIRNMTKEFTKENINSGLEEVTDLTEKVIADRCKIKEELEEIRPEIINNILTQLLNGSRNERAMVMNYVSQLKSAFSQNTFICAKIFIEDCSEFIKDDTLEEMSLTRLVLRNVTEELFSEYFDSVCVELDIKSVVLICSVPSDENGTVSKDTCSRIEKTLKMCEKILKNKFKIYLSIGISQPHHEVESLYICHRQASTVLNSNIVSGIYDISWYNEKIEDQKNYEYSLEDEICLINSLKMGDFEKTKVILDEIILENQGLISAGNKMLTQCLLLDLISSLLRVCNELNIPSSVVNLNISNFFAENNNIKLFRKLYDECENLCNWIYKNKKSHNSYLKDQIITYINEHFSENSMSLIEVADHMGINSSYLSSFIKENMSDTFLAYVTNLRMEKAKDLLLNTDLSLQEIAEYIGYANSGAFIRVFKKKFAYTPGVYLNQNK